ncbi:hypothetical protein ACFVY0_44830 [Streptomyces sp. NPDC058286]|uniref:hypothetical protein n=1 Tax=Streptomyces sp. NPDC058286 TaxID=3346422 RepID=UPI0036E4EEAD
MSMASSLLISGPPGPYQAAERPISTSAAAIAATVVLTGQGFLQQSPPRPPAQFMITARCRQTRWILLIALIADPVSSGAAFVSFLSVYRTPGGS